VNSAAGPSAGRSRDLGALVAAARDGDVRAVARLVSLVEDGDERVPQIAEALAPYTGGAQVVGLTGAPGVGKSTLTGALVRAYRSQGRRVAVLAVDPSSPYTGGAILGDRIRMQEHATDPGVFIRSMSSRGNLGGLAAATPQAVRVLDAAGYEIVLVETVGVGQAEVDVAALADTTLVLLAPGLGDAIQAVKAGILEIADVFVVNKADREGADATVRDLRGMLTLGERVGRTADGADDHRGGADDRASWRVPVLKTVAERGEGVDEVVAAIARHREFLLSQGELTVRRQRRAAAEIEHLALGLLRARLAATPTGPGLAELAADVAAGRTDPYTAAATLVAALHG
jgi:LAO/AO transport system ATPase